MPKPAMLRSRSVVYFILFSSVLFFGSFLCVCYMFCLLSFYNNKKSLILLPPLMLSKACNSKVSLLLIKLFLDHSNLISITSTLFIV